MALKTCLDLELRKEPVHQPVVVVRLPRQGHCNLQILVPKSRDWLKHTLQRETTMRDEKLNIQDLEAKDMNRDIDSNRYDISDPRNPLNMRRRGAK